MAQFGVVVEAQEGLTWERWRRVANDAERLGFASLRVSDHLGSVMNPRFREGLPAWSALHLAAEWTQGIELAPMVSPVTFYQPGVLLREALAVDQLSGGRLLLGLGAGWNQAEHERFEILFGDWKYRFDRLEQAIQLMQRLWGELPGARPLPLLIGGAGRRRTLPLVARYAREWNGEFPHDADAYRKSVAALDEACAAIGRDPGSIRHSLQTVFIIGRNQDELRDRAMQLNRLVGEMAGSVWLGGETPDEVIASAKQHYPAIGTPDDVVERLRAYVDAGVDLFMFEHFLHLDTEELELMATEVMPALAAMGREVWTSDALE